MVGGAPVVIGSHCPVIVLRTYPGGQVVPGGGVVGPGVLGGGVPVVMGSHLPVIVLRTYPGGQVVGGGVVVS